MRTLVFFAFLSVVGYTTACSCIPRTEAQKFCDADFVILVEVIGNGFPLGTNKIYAIDLIQTYRSNRNDWIFENAIFTATSSAACGVTLQQGKYYVLSGYYQGWGGMYTGSCSLIKMFNTNPQYTYQPPSCPAWPNSLPLAAAEKTPAK